MGFKHLLISCSLLLSFSCKSGNSFKVNYEEVQSFIFKSALYEDRNKNFSMTLQQGGNYRIEYYCSDSAIIKEGKLSEVEISNLVNLVNKSSFGDTSSLIIIKVYPSHMSYQEFSIKFTNGKQISDDYIVTGKEAITKLLYKIGLETRSMEYAKCR